MYTSNLSIKNLSTSLSEPMRHSIARTNGFGSNGSDGSDGSDGSVAVVFDLLVVSSAYSWGTILAKAPKMASFYLLSICQSSETLFSRITIWRQVFGEV